MQPDTLFFNKKIPRMLLGALGVTYIVSMLWVDHPKVSYTYMASSVQSRAHLPFGFRVVT